MENKTDSEMKFIEEVTHSYVTSDSHQDRLIKSLAIRSFKPYIRSGGKALEFGCCDGYMTSLIYDLVDELTVIDGSESFINMARKKVPEDVNFTHSLFEEYSTENKYDYIFATYVLEHVQDAIDFLSVARGLLNDHGLLFIVVPNARALSRQLARHMGLIDDLFALTKNDLNHGHRRVYDRTLLNRDIEGAGLSHVGQGGLFLKLLADFQMDEMIEAGILGEEQLEGLYKMGLEYPDLAGSLFSICMDSQKNPK